MTYKKCRPPEMTVPLLNPHKGLATFQRFEGDPLYDREGYSEEGPLDFPDRVHDVAPGYLPTTVAYCRWFWEKVEPEEGRFDFSMIEEALATARSRNQTLNVRLMPTGAQRQPWAPAWYLEKYATQASDRFEKPYPVPVWDSSAYVDLWSRLIHEFGNRFDANPTLDCVDMAFVGAWGEGQGDCAEAAVDAITAAYAQAHPQTKRVAMVGSYKMTAGVRSGAGWRCDSCDDLGLWPDASLPKEEQWNHLYDFYPEAVVTCSAQDAWKAGPVLFEPGKVMMTAHRLGFDIDFIIQQDLKYHGSVFSAKSNPLPPAWMERFSQFANDLGYRFVLRQVKTQARVERGASFSWNAWIENVGVAPIYYAYPLVLRIKQGKRIHHVHATANISTWLPGDAWGEEETTIPDTFDPGVAELALAIVEPGTDQPYVRFASEGAAADGWFPVNTIDIL